MPRGRSRLRDERLPRFAAVWGVGDYFGWVSRQPPKVRRTLNFWAFLVSGGLVGLLVGFLLSVFGNPDPRYDAPAAMGFIGLICAGLGGLAGGIIAVLLDKRS
jgi:hypothetical protein